MLGVLVLWLIYLLENIPGGYTFWISGFCIRFRYDLIELGSPHSHS